MTKAIEMAVDDTRFVFSMTPYYLRLRLPYACIDDERSNATYDASNEVVAIKLPKAVKGQHFPDLDLSAKLLARAPPQKTGPLIEEMQPNTTEPTNERTSNDSTAVLAEEGTAFNWEIEQETPLELLGESKEVQDKSITLEPSKYGFCNQYSDIVGVSVANGNDINDVSDPEHTSFNDRVSERISKENWKFDPDSYVSEYLLSKYPSPEDGEYLYALIMSWKSPVTKTFLTWYKLVQQIPIDKRPQIMPVEFTKEEQDRMLDLPRRSLLIEPNNLQSILLTITSILFAYHFEQRENEGDHTIESAWTIGILTPQIASLESQLIEMPNNSNKNLLQAAIVASIRRALSYPLHRNYDLCMKVWDDVYYNIRGGKRSILKSLLDIRELFRVHDVLYVYDRIWLQDLCLFIMSDSVSENNVRALAHDLKKQYSQITKNDIVFEKLRLEDLDEEMDTNEEAVEIKTGYDVWSVAELEQLAEASYSDMHNS
ncbi:uncharacterized protein KQ657_003696 [Scheffersomyces spartinae]|uniref:CS domain-containing protein n=1 Tax=Scheffersomyces spartinae TaxID=45513 RepID=A0A9P7VC60_9ASCO|nr:uncharacterized protein KQ657_003696 [Scheffersomyces spartinae]KAG7195172.1 hypothetical protein KQ657_003696 [Scheffersomyces spartinae]